MQQHQYNDEDRERRPLTTKCMRLLVVSLLAGICFQTGYSLGFDKGGADKAFQGEQSVTRIRQIYSAPPEPAIADAPAAAAAQLSAPVLITGADARRDLEG